MITLQQHKKQLLKDPEFKKLYYTPDDLGTEFKILRKLKGLTQKQVAQRVGTKQESISRFENDNYQPSLTFITKLANAIGYGLDVKFIKL